MKKDIIVAELWDRGIIAEETTTWKNGIEFESLSFDDPAQDSNIKPTFRVKDLEEIPDEDVINVIINAIENKPEVVDLLEKFEDKEYIANHVMACIRKKTNNETDIKKEVFGDLEEYIRIELEEMKKENGDMATCVLRKDMLNRLPFDEKMLFAYAEANSHKKVSITPIEKVLFNIERPKAGIKEITGSQLYVMTTNEMCHGASAMLFQDYLEDIAKNNNTKTLTIIPSSIHEVLIWIGDMEANEMINQVNNECIKDTDVLSDHSYKFTLSE